MRYLSIFLAMLLMMGVASAAWYPGTATVKVQSLDAAETTDTDQIKVAAVNEFNSTTHFVLTSSGASSSGFLAQPDVCRNIIATMNTSTSGSLKLTGTNINGETITENLTWAAASGAKSSTKAFETITRVDGTCTTNTAQFILGTGDLLGMRATIGPTNTVFMAALGGTREATAPSVTVSSTDVSLCTIDTSTAPGGAVTKFWYA